MSFPNAESSSGPLPCVAWKPPGHPVNNTGKEKFLRLVLSLDSSGLAAGSKNHDKTGEPSVLKDEIMFI